MHFLAELSDRDHYPDSRICLEKFLRNTVNRTRTWNLLLFWRTQLYNGFNAADREHENFACFWGVPLTPVAFTESSCTVCAWTLLHVSQVTQKLKQAERKCWEATKSTCFQNVAYSSKYFHGERQNNGIINSPGGTKQVMQTNVFWWSGILCTVSGFQFLVAKILFNGLTIWCFKIFRLWHYCPAIGQMKWRCNQYDV